MNRRNFLAGLFAGLFAGLTGALLPRRLRAVQPNKNVDVFSSLQIQQWDNYFQQSLRVQELLNKVSASQDYGWMVQSTDRAYWEDRSEREEKDFYNELLGEPHLPLHPFPPGDIRRYIKIRDYSSPQLCHLSSGCSAVYARERLAALGPADPEVD